MAVGKLTLVEQCDSFSSEAKQLQLKLAELSEENATLAAAKATLADEQARLVAEKKRLAELEREMGAAVAGRDNTAAELYRALLQLAELQERDSQNKAVVEAYELLSKEHDHLHGEADELKEQVTRLSEERATVESAWQELSDEAVTLSESQQRMADENASVSTVNTVPSTSVRSRSSALTVNLPRVELSGAIQRQAIEIFDARQALLIGDLPVAVARALGLELPGGHPGFRAVFGEHVDDHPEKQAFDAGSRDPQPFSFLNDDVAGAGSSILLWQRRSRGLRSADGLNSAS